MDKSCYLYEQSYSDYINSLGGDMMTVFEPILLYSNIKNGLGLFGAYCTKEYYFPRE